MRKARILVVDDERLNLNIMVSILSEDYEVIIAKSGEQALKRIEAQAPDLILLDITMPDMDGYMVFDRLDAIAGHRKIPVIFITSKRSPEEEIKGLKMGAVDYITKPFSPAILEVRVANQIESKRNKDELERLNRTDVLTGIANRRHFDEYFALRKKELARSNSTLAIIMIDIDYFKQFNDCYGHGDGDDCLKVVANTLTDTLKRQTDLVARYGGEEFVVILPATELSGATRCAQRLCEAISNLCIPHEKSNTSNYVTVSLGVAALTSDQREVTADSLLKLADKALYQAKTLGRNQCVISTQV